MPLEQAQQPLLPVSFITSPARLPSRPGSRSTSPIKQLVQGDVIPALQTAAANLMRRPLILLAAAVLLACTGALVVWLVTAKQVPTLAVVLQRIEGRPGECCGLPCTRCLHVSCFAPCQARLDPAFSNPSLRLPTGVQQHSVSVTLQQHGGRGSAAASVLDALALPQHATQQQQQQHNTDEKKNSSKQRDEWPTPGSSGGNASTDGERIFDIHEIAGVPQLFGTS